jgi:7,8-dihydropterin-6-yl-methyl-4-(beta-D-ribofuranosyl)aminobenzene 5'-phosphate synthase
MEGKEMPDDNWVSKLTITVLAEDYAGYDSPLLGTHGISLLLHIHKSDRTTHILFDVSQSSETILHNMKILGISPHCVDLVFISHCHYDHTGGLLGMLKAIGEKDIPVIAHSTLFRSHYFFEPALKYIGVPRESAPPELERFGRFVPADDSFSLMPGVISTGEVKREVAFEKSVTLKLFTEQNGKFVQDQMKDDLSLVIKMENQGLVIVTGCSHAGIINIVQHAIRLTDEKRVRAVIGGLHLVDADKDRIEKTAKALYDLDVQDLYVGHCTGLKGEASLLSLFKDRLSKLHSGMRIQF